MFVDGVAGCGRDEGRDGEEEVGEEEEEDDGEGGAEGRGPVPAAGFGVREVEVEEAEGDRGVYDCEGVGDDWMREFGWLGLDMLELWEGRGRTVEDEVVCVSCGRSDDDDHRHQPMQTQSSSRGTKRLVASKEAGEGNHAFSCQLLIDCRYHKVRFRIW